MPNPEAIRARLLEAFPGARIDVTDLTGTQDHFQAVVVAPQFGGKSRVAGFFTRPESFVTSVRCRVGFCFVRRTRARLVFMSHLP